MVAFSTLNGHLLKKTMTTTTMHSPHFLYPNSSTNNNNNNPIRLSLTTHYPPPSRNSSLITCARTTNNKGLFRSKQSKKTLVHLLRFTASHLPYILPEPLNSVIREFGGGFGSGGGGNWKGFGWGGFDGGGGGRKKRVNKNFKFWLLGFAVACCLGFWWLNLSGRIELKNDVVLGAMCLSMFLVLVNNGCVPEWVLGFCGGGLIVGMSVDKRSELNKVVRGLLEMMGGSRRQRRRRRGV